MFPYRNAGLQGKSRTSGIFLELSSTCKENPEENFYFGTQKDITIDRTALFWKTWFKHGFIMCKTS